MTYNMNIEPYIITAQNTTTKNKKLNLISSSDVNTNIDVNCNFKRETIFIKFKKNIPSFITIIPPNEKCILTIK